MSNGRSTRAPEGAVFYPPGRQDAQKQSDGAIGYDAYLRAIVSPNEMDPANKVLRKALFDFKTLPEISFLERVRGLLGFKRKHLNPLHVRKRKDGTLIYHLMPGESVLGAVGFITEMEFPYYYWLSPRSGLASRSRVTLGNAPGTVDPDYRGEAGVIIVNEGTEPFELELELRIAQVIFEKAIIPEEEVVESYEDLSGTKRGSGGFGSTGTKDHA